MSCGVGVQYRDIACITRTNDEFVVLPARNCSDLKPATEQACRMSACSPEWFTSDWSTVKYRECVNYVKKIFANNFFLWILVCISDNCMPDIIFMCLVFSVPQHAGSECKHGLYDASSRVLAVQVVRKSANRAWSNDVTWSRARRRCQRRTNRRKVKKKLIESLHQSMNK